MPYAFACSAVHDEIAFHVLVDFFKRLSRVAGEEIVERCAGADDLFRMDIDVGGLAGEAGHPWPVHSLVNAVIRGA